MYEYVVFTSYALWKLSFATGSSKICSVFIIMKEKKIKKKKLLSQTWIFAPRLNSAQNPRSRSKFPMIDIIIPKKNSVKNKLNALIVNNNWKWIYWEKKGCSRFRTESVIEPLDQTGLNPLNSINSEWKTWHFFSCPPCIKFACRQAECYIFMWFDYKVIRPR